MTKVPQSNRLLLFLAAFAASTALHAQQLATVNFRVFTEPPGAKFAVDGVVYLSAANFQWPAGSKHIVRYVQDVLAPSLVSSADPSVPALSPGQLSPDGAVLYAFTGWSDSTGLLSPATDPIQIVTADPAVTWLKLSVVLGYRVFLNFFDGSPASLPASCGAPGTAPSGQLRVGLAYINGQCYWNNALLYFPAGTQLQLNAFPYPGFVFLGWSGIGSSNAYLQTFALKGPLTLVPRFSPGKRVRFTTNPLGLQVLVDRTPTPTLTSADPNAACPLDENLPIAVFNAFRPLCLGDFDFAPGSIHLVGAPTPQIDLSGKTWVFDSWASGLGQNAPYAADNQTSVSDAVVVKFVPAARASFLSNPLGLKLTVDDRSNWPVYNFVWGIGTTHLVTAPSQQIDAAGRKYTFRNWSNGGSASQTVTMDQSAVDSGFRLIANYDVLSRVVVQTSPPGQNVLVDGVDCQTPCIVDRASGNLVRVTAPNSIAVSDGVRLDLNGWSDGGAADHAYTINSDFQTLTATYATSFRLTATSDPPNGASLRLDPSSPDLFYPSDTQLSVGVDGKAGFKFRRWGGDLTGTYPSAILAMSGPRSVTALMDRVPYIAPAGVKSAAGDTSDGTVSPGSLVAITGESLAPDTVQGRVNPLAQTVGGLTVTIADRLLPIVSVSPDHVIVQLPSDLIEGDYTLQVHAQGQPDVSGTFTVSRNAPGLFSTSTQAGTYAMAIHADGSPVTPDSPAAAGETVTLLGTGFGPYTQPVLDGFFPVEPVPQVLDPVEILMADQVIPPDWSGAASGYTGTVAVRLKIPNSLPAGASVGVSVRVNGKLSNAVRLPLL